MMPRHGRDDTALGRRALWAIAVVALAVGGYYAYRQLAKPPAPPPSEVVSAPLPETPAAPVIENPVVPPAPAAPLPPLNDSDPVAIEQLTGLPGGEQLAGLFAKDDLIRRITATIDNLPRGKVATRLRPMKPMDSAFVADGEEGAYTLGPDNYARYTPYVRIVESIDPDELAALYLRLYPLFQQAYVELGNLDGYFNDRVVKVIDHLLATPQIDGPIALERPNVMYTFADPALESRSAGQKFLIRMGPDNAARIKARLRALRERIAARPPGP